MPVHDSAQHKIISVNKKNHASPKRNLVSFDIEVEQNMLHGSHITWNTMCMKLCALN